MFSPFCALMMAAYQEFRVITIDFRKFFGIHKYGGCYQEQFGRYGDSQTVLDYNKFLL